MKEETPLRRFICTSSFLNLFYRANYAAELVGGFLAKYEGLAVFVLNDAGGLVVDHEELFDLFPS